MAHAFFLGIDVADETSDVPGAVTATLLEKTDTGNDTLPQYRLDRIAHYDTPPPVDTVADRLQSLVAETPYIGRTTIVVNTTTGTGRTLHETLDARGLAPSAVTLTGGMGTTSEATETMGVHLAEYDAVETLATAYREGRLDVSGPATEAVSQLARGIQSFVEALTDAEDATETPDDVSARPQRPEAFDTHVTSAALAVWTGTERSFDPTEHLREPPTNASPSV